MIRPILKLLSILIFFTTLARAEEIPLVISDVDDTLKQTYVRASGSQRWRFFWYSARTDRPFSQVSQVLYALVCKPQPLYNTNCDNYDDDAELYKSSLYYVTGSPGPLSKFGSEFLEDMQFPQGHLYYRPLSEDSTLNYKISAITKIISQNKQKNTVIFLGDNGQYDPEVYNTISMQHQNRQTYYTFIRMVYESPIAAQLFPGQIGFYTSIDLAYALYRFGQITSSDFTLIHKSTLADFKSSPQKVIPDFMSCSGWRSQLDSLAPPPEDAEALRYFADTWSALLQVCR